MGETTTERHDSPGGDVATSAVHEDRRFTFGLMYDVAKVIEAHGYEGVLTGPALVQLQGPPVRVPAWHRRRSRRPLLRQGSGAGAAVTGAEMEARERQAAAGAPLLASELAARFDRSPRWGRQVIADLLAAERGHGSHPAATSVPASAPPVTAAVRRTTTVAVVVVAAVAAVISYEHMRSLAEAAGEEWRAVLLPLSVDGMLVAASMTALVRRRAGQPAGLLAWTALLLGVAASVAANVAAAQPTIEGRLVAAWPPLALLLALELALQQHRRR